MYGMHKLKYIRKELKYEAAEKLALGIAMCHLDYSNAFLLGLLLGPSTILVPNAL